MLLVSNGEKFKDTVKWALSQRLKHQFDVLPLGSGFFPRSNAPKLMFRNVSARVTVLEEYLLQTQIELGLVHVDHANFQHQE